MEKYQDIMKHVEYWKEKNLSEYEVNKIRQIRRLYDYVYETAVNAEDLRMEIARLEYENQQLRKRIEKIEEKLSVIEIEENTNE